MKSLGTNLNDNNYEEFSIESPSSTPIARDRSP